MTYISHNDNAEMVVNHDVQNLTLKALDRASTATEMGPFRATAAFKSDSLPYLIATTPDSLAPI